MNSILNTENQNRHNVSNNYGMEAPVEQAKISGLLCIGCAVTAVFFAFCGSLPGVFAAWGITLYFVFLLLTAVLGLIGYSEIKALGSGPASTIFLFFSAVFLFVLFLSIPGESEGFRFGIIYGLFAVIVPVMLTILTLLTNKVALWKALIPLVIPILHLIAYPLIKSSGFAVAASLLSLGWGLLGVVIYQKRG